jgi:hypothetical protein
VSLNDVIIDWWTCVQRKLPAAVKMFIIVQVTVSGMRSSRCHQKEPDGQF